MLNAEEAYRIAMQSTLDWVERNMDPKRTRVFFTSMSPTHLRYVYLACFGCPKNLKTKTLGGFYK